MLSLRPSTASTCSRRNDILPPMPRNFFLAPSTILPVTAAPFATTITSPARKSSAVTNRSACPSCASEGISSANLMRIGEPSVTVMTTSLSVCVTGAGWGGGAADTTGAGVGCAGVEEDVVFEGAVELGPPAPDGGDPDATFVEL